MSTSCLNQSHEHPWAPEQAAVHLPFHQQATDQGGGDRLGGACEKGLGKVWGDLEGRGGYGSGLQVFIHPADIKLWMTQNGGITPTHSAAMSGEKLKAFLEAAQADAGLQEKLKAAADANAVAAIAKDAGFSITADDLKSALNAQSQISEEELEGVAAGSRGAMYAEAQAINFLLICNENILHYR